jgi:hypothetical protein
MVDVMNHTQQLFNSAERKGSGTDGGGIKGQVGGVHPIFKGWVAIGNLFSQ